MDKKLICNRNLIVYGFVCVLAGFLIAFLVKSFVPNQVKAYNEEEWIVFQTKEALPDKVSQVVANAIKNSEFAYTPVMYLGGSIKDKEIHYCVLCNKEENARTDYCLLYVASDLNMNAHIEGATPVQMTFEGAQND